jgi:DNA invertase Pin-like site-specific DNA recombinase
MAEIASTKARKRCAVYCRVSSDERLDQEFNSIDAQKEAGHAFIDPAR